MKDEMKLWLYDILTAIAEIESFVDDIKNNFYAYQNETKTKRAIERNMEIIGEAMKRVLSHAPNVAISNARKIVDTRNVIIHAYDSLSDEMIWSIVIKHLPVLKAEIEALLQNT